MSASPAHRHSTPKLRHQNSTDDAPSAQQTCHFLLIAGLLHTATLCWILTTLANRLQSTKTSDLRPKTTAHSAAAARLPGTCILTHCCLHLQHSCTGSHQLKTANCQDVSGSVQIHPVLKPDYAKQQRQFKTPRHTAKNSNEDKLNRDAAAMLGALTIL